MLDVNINSVFFNELKKIFKEEKSEKISLLFDKLNSSCKAFLIGHLINNITTNDSLNDSLSNDSLSKKYKRDILIISHGTSEDFLIEDLKNFNEKVFHFPSFGPLIDKTFTPSPDILGERMTTLSKISKEKGNKVVIAPVESALQKTISKNEVEKSKFFSFKIDANIDFDSLPEKLEEIGYKRVSIVSDKKEFAIRGGIIDIFSTSSPLPYRIEFFEDQIESIRTFDVANQLTIEKKTEVNISLANELSKIESKESCFLIDYLNDPIIIFDDMYKIEDNYINFKKLLKNKKSNSFFISLDDFFQKIKQKDQLFLSSGDIEKEFQIKLIKKEKFFREITFDFENIHIKTKKALHPFIKIENLFLSSAIEKEYIDIFDQVNFLNESRYNLYFFFEKEKEKELIIRELKERNIFLNKFEFIRGFISSSFTLIDSLNAYISFSEFSKKKRIRRQKNRSTYYSPIAKYHNLEKGDLVVHFHSGIGKYLGIEKHKNHLGSEDEFIVIEYKNSSKLFIPISQAYLVSKYIGSGEEEKPVLSTLGENKWQKAKTLAQTKIIGYAKELLDLYAERSTSTKVPLEKDSEDMELFEEEFSYEETVDQKKAIFDIKKDFLNEKPMERLICGDVGYGKTEVAMRAAFKAVVDGKKQVALLVPTTVLAQQHFETFKERMDGFALNIEMVSRFNTTKKNKEILEKVSLGEVDILVGTHRLLSKDVQFFNLGLIIIDEEQRFGVKAKEHLKKLRKNIDSLTLSATPIPRTLYMSLINIRDISTISTPPQDRLPIKTILSINDDDVIKNAILFELSREGQVFFIHNRVESIYKRKEYIQELLPHAKILVVHGQMKPKDIDDIFHKFKSGQANILLTTTIVENGIDIPNANTILIDHADTFGLADLYQLRGRVGRWNRPAFAYLLTAKNKSLSEISKKRLSALAESSGYGSGMKIAMRDLEIRGAGDILGLKQSGQISALGFHLYCKLLKKAINALKNKKSINFTETKMEFSFPAYLPDSYIFETDIKMEIYHRLGDAEDEESIGKIKNELIDRFGKLPLEVNWLLELNKIKVFASKRYISNIKFEKYTLKVQMQKRKKIIEKSFLLPKDKQKEPSILKNYFYSLFA